jgi:group I intron endonuclease
MINIKVNKDFRQLSSNFMDNLPFTPVKVYHNMLTDKDNILNDFKNQSGIYLIHNLVNGTQYIGSASNFKKRLYAYYNLNLLLDNRYISNSILKYGHDNFSFIIVETVTTDRDDLKKTILEREQYYIDTLKPKLNINPTAGSMLGFKHSEETKQLLASLRTGTKLSEETKALLSKLKMGTKLSEDTKEKLSKLFSGELNPFHGKTHNQDTLLKMRLSKIGELNPMFGKEKSIEFIEQMYRDKTGSNNPMWGKTHSEETLSKMRKAVWVYDSNSKVLIKKYDGIVQAKKDMMIGYNTIKKYLDSSKSYKGKLFRSSPID